MDFVTERKRLANELKAAGDKDGSARVAKLGRPSVSAWAVNQLWWREQPAFEDLLAAAARVRAGEREATKAHKAALAALRDKAAALLAAAGNAASETTLRRITTTLSALAATGGFEPDAPGALVADRDPPGFETLEGMLASSPTPDATSKPDRAAEQRAEEERRRAEEAARQTRLLERQRLSAACERSARSCVTRSSATCHGSARSSRPPSRT